MKLNSLTKSYGSLKVLENFSLELSHGGITALLGPSGCGKTTILNAVSGLIDYSGSIEGGGNISYIFQSDRLLGNLTVRGNIEYVLRAAVRDKDERRERIDRILRLVELTDKAEAYPDELSGGMKRRVSIARAFAYPSEVLLMDEPFKGLDIALKVRLMRVFQDLWELDRRLTLFVTHDVEESLLLSDRVCVLRGLPAEVVLDERLSSDKRSRLPGADFEGGARRRITQALLEL